jgi:hypothetical protein
MDHTMPTPCAPTPTQAAPADVAPPFGAADACGCECALPFLTGIDAPGRTGEAARESDDPMPALAPPR